MANAEVAVEVVHSPAPAEVRCVALRLAAGSTVRAALGASGLFDAAEIDTLDCGVWGRRTRPDTALRDGDRVEVYRPLTIDPKEARRLRARRKSIP